MKCNSPCPSDTVARQEPGTQSGIQTVGELRYSVGGMIARHKFRGVLCSPALALLVACAAASSPAAAQSGAPAVPRLSARAETSPTASIRTAKRHVENPDGLLPLPAAGVPIGLEPFFDLGNSDIKFSFARLTEILRDKKHEGWVLAAYPDPKTSDPLIGAGFTLSLPARQHRRKAIP